MNKFFKGLICAGLCCTMLSAVGCKKAKLDSEKRQLILATGALDGNFNPFFYTSQNDGNMLSMTQISMLTTNEKGELVCGDDWPTVVQSYTKKYYDAKTGGNEVQEGTVNGRTEYEFTIKSGIKFSDGVELTMKDVLFNLYVYLDPAYTGSSTMYSTDIQGLKAYRSQNPAMTDDQDSTLEAGFASTAQRRINNLIAWSEDNSIEGTEPTEPTLKADYDKTVKLFREEAESDWVSVSTSWYDSYKDTHRFTEAWQAYLFNEGIVKVQQRMSTETNTYVDIKDENGKYYTTLDNDMTTGTPSDPVHANHIRLIAEATTDAKIQEYQANYPANHDGETCTAEYAKEQLQKDYCVKVVVEAYTVKSQIANVLRYWATANSVLEDITGEVRSDYFATNGGRVKTISGITTPEPNKLKIVVNGVDPKAIYNFSFVVAPMHYYSGKYTDKNGNYKGDYTSSELCNGVDTFGVDMGNKDFYDKVLRATAKNGLPVGAGAYKATNSKGDENASRSGFFSNNICYFARNEYFETVAANISNAKIKFINYKVMADDKIMEALQKGEIDFGTPNATYTNLNTVTSAKNLDEKHYATGGYGYVGVNPKFVPEYPVRQAIMKAMDTTKTVAYFGTSLADTIYRPMSTTSWAYPKDENGDKLAGVKNADKYQYSSIKFNAETNVDEIKALVESAGYTLQNGIYTKTSQKGGMANAKDGTTLKLTFTIAGETTDHPAYKMFLDAQKTLNEIGFDITVSTDIQALKKMNTGNLAVWAAAWSAAVDPDLYQVYHKDSNATSVLNWNYRNILNNSSTWRYEYDIIAGRNNNLSDLINRARTMDDQDTRAAIYADCLDLIMELAVELPTYQRMDLCVYNKNVIAANSLVKNPGFNMGLFDKIWEINYV
ncbi:MAG: hypothetical protein K2K60_04580 [Clostridia bacterium]|nr:hypothetical protein [Clostridia bacterium]